MALNTSADISAFLAAANASSGRSLIGAAPLANPTFTGTVTGNFTGPLTGNSSTATALETARSINGVSFNGTANITAPTNLTVTAAPTTITITSDTGTDAVIQVPDGTNAGVMLAADKDKLDGIADGATANNSTASIPGLDNALAARLPLKLQPLNGQAQVRPVLSAAGTTSTIITSQVLIGFTSPTILYTRAATAIAGSTFPNWNYVKQVNITSSNSASTFAASTLHYGTEIGIKVLGSGSNYRWRVDGRIATEVTTLPGDGNEYYQKITFPDARHRTITVEGSAQFNFGGFLIGPKDSTMTPPQRPGPRAIFLGDSYTEPNGSSYGYTGWASLVGEQLGWDAWPSGSGGTGYMNNAGGGGRFKFAGRLGDVTSWSPRIVVVAGGINDAALAEANPSGFAAEVDAVLGGIRAALPNLEELIVVGPWDVWNGSGAARDAVRTTLIAKATQYGAIFIDVKGIFTGSGNSGSQTATGNQNIYINTDGTHPTQNGHNFLAATFIRQYLAAKGLLGMLDDQTADPSDTPVWHVGGVTPEGVATAGFARLAASLTDGSVWSKTSSSGNTGWRQLAWVESVTSATPVTDGAVAANTSKQDEQLYITPAGTLAALTITLPPVASARLGQKIDVHISQIITALTVSVSGGGAVTGGSPDTSAANSSFGYRCVSTAGAGTWLLYRRA